MSITGTELYSNDMEGKRNDVLYVGAFVFMGIKTFSVKMLFIQTGKYHTKRVGLMGAYTRPEPRTLGTVAFMEDHTHRNKDFCGYIMNCTINYASVNSFTNSFCIILLVIYYLIITF